MRARLSPTYSMTAQCSFTRLRVCIMYYTYMARQRNRKTWYKHAGETIFMSDSKDVLKRTEVQPPNRSSHPVSHVGFSHGGTPHVPIHLYRCEGKRSKYVIGRLLRHFFIGTDYCQLGRLSASTFSIFRLSTLVVSFNLTTHLKLPCFGSDATSLLSLSL